MTRIREATLDDFPSIRAVCLRNNVGYPGQNPDVDTEDSFTAQYENFVEFWKTNPVRSAFDGVPIGWVLESKDGDIVGSLSNIPSLYSLNGGRIKAAVASSWAVDPEFRGESLALISKFLFQKNVHLLLDTTANNEAEKVLKAFRAKPVPVPKYDEVRFRIVRHRRFFKKIMKSRLSFGSELFSWILSAASKSIDYVRLGRISFKNLAEVHQVALDDPDLGKFFEVLLENSKRLIAFRSTEIMRWHFPYSFDAGKAHIFIQKNNQGEIGGYIILRRRDTYREGLSRFQIIDIQALNDDTKTLRKLTKAAIAFTFEAGMDIIELIGPGQEKKRILKELLPQRRSLDCWPFLYKATNSELARLLDNANVWDPSLFDGDGCLG